MLTESPVIGIRRARVRFKEWAAKHFRVIEFCHDCGRRQPLIWTAHDDVWARFATGQKPLCPECFDARAVAAGVLVRWIPTIDTVLSR